LAAKTFIVFMVLSALWAAERHKELSEIQQCNCHWSIVAAASVFFVYMVIAPAFAAIRSGRYHISHHRLREISFLTLLVGILLWLLMILLLVNFVAFG
jgi:hypothetical protein